MISVRKNGLKFTSGERALELFGVRDPEGVPLFDPAVPDPCELMCACIPENVYQAYVRILYRNCMVQKSEKFTTQY